ncbi:MAG: glycerophosphodiester phosphodiesterase family protein [Pseudomonadota bacterium]
MLLHRVLVLPATLFRAMAKRNGLEVTLMRYVLFCCFFFGLSACSEVKQASETSAELPVISSTSLPSFFDCVRETGGLLIAAHRGGPVEGFPENAIETLQHGFDAGIRVFEVDVATSRDGVLFLLHDRSLGRTTTGNGSVANTDWNVIARLALKDNSGETTEFAPPRLSDALEWAKANGALLELDKKDTTGWRSLILAVRSAGAENNVLLITYSDTDAALVQRLAPEMMLTTGARGGRDLNRLADIGVDRKKVIAWTGTEAADPPAWRRLADEGVEAAFGTLGRPGERLDDTYWSDGDGSEYEALVEAGLVLLATDAPYRVAEWLSADDRALNACSAP